MQLIRINAPERITCFLPVSHTPEAPSPMAIGSSHDLTPVIDLTLDRGTGPFRTRHPIWSDLRPPCNHACPAGENIQGWLALAQAGEYRKAWEILVADNPLPATHGRVCYHPCESNCNRGEMDAAVSIHAVERFLGDRAAAEAWDYPRHAPPSGKQVLVVGAGPSGLSAAYHLTRLGHQVEIHEAGPIAGGMLQFGIPAYRLPRAELAAEVARIERFGVRIVLNHPVTDVKAEQQNGRFDAVFVAIGAHVAQHAEIPAREAAKILDAVSMLSQIGSRRQTHPRPPRRHLRRRQYGDGRRPHRPPPRRRGGLDHLPPRPRAHARARFRGR